MPDARFHVPDLKTRPSSTAASDIRHPNIYHPVSSIQYPVSSIHPMRLSILDQSIVHHGKTAAEALAETIDTAKLADQLGYHRFWVSEHHNSRFIAGSAPELLMVRLAAETTRIRIGSGGIMLPNHSTLKMAENFRLLEALYPGRIDMGMGRAPGTDRITSSILNPSNDFSEQRYLQQLEHLQHYFTDQAGTSHGPLLAVPQAATVPHQWILSSSGGSVKIAAQFGMGLAVARFINSFVTSSIVRTYRAAFQPAEHMPQPQAFLALFVLCGETEAKAKAMRKFMDYVLLQFERGKFDDFGDAEKIGQYQFSPDEQLRLQYNSGRIVSGTKEQVKEQLTAMAAEFDVDEIMVSVMANNTEDRWRSFELMAEAFDLPAKAS